MPEISAVERAVPWFLRGSWVLVLVLGGRALDGALDGAGEGAVSATRWVALGWWVGGVAAMAIAGVVALTATRVLVPTAIPAAAAVWIGGAATADALGFLGVAVVATMAACSGELGRAFVQASAYGDEDRHPLRPPLPYLLVAVAAWTVWVGVGVVAAVATASGRWVVASIGWALVVGGGYLGVPRWHRLSRRWLVLVPAGVVLHDHVVLGETLMLRRQDIAGIGLAPVDTDAYDLTGPAPGHAIEVRTFEPVTVLVGTSAEHPGGAALHLTGCLVAPTRPGRALGAAAGRRLPVGALA